MTEAMPFLQKYDITFLRPPTIRGGGFFPFSYALHRTGMTVKKMANLFPAE